MLMIHLVTLQTNYELCVVLMVTNCEEFWEELLQWNMKVKYEFTFACKPKQMGIELLMVWLPLFMSVIFIRQFKAHIAAFFIIAE